MKVSAIFLFLISCSLQAGEICGDYKIIEESALGWAETSFTKERAIENMAVLQFAIDNDGEANTCGLHNALQIVEGYILKQQAESALKQVNVPKVVVDMQVGGFCEFIRLSKPCE